MAAQLEDIVLDTGLNGAIKTLGAFIYICQAEPTTYAIASTSGLLGFKSWGAGNAFASTVTGSPNGRQTASIAITDGTITTTGTASWWAVCSTAALLAHGTLSAPQAVTATNTFTLAAFNIRIPNQ